MNLDLTGRTSSAATDSTSTDDAANTKSPTKFRTQSLAHTNWICDIALTQNNNAVATASQDQLVKLWRPHASQNEEPYKIGEHADYVKCVASPGQSATWVATGGFDRKVYLWDLNGAGKKLEIDTKGEEVPEKGSVYSLSTTENMLAYGGPESILHLWDPRAGKRITKFRGHTSNIRSILLSAAGDMVMTASADQTVKVWSVTAGRCMHTLTMHNDSVWSLYSEDPGLSVFYSSDRSGLVVKTDVRGTMGELDDGLSLAVAQEHDMVYRVVAAGDHIWTATQRSSINRWRNVDTGVDIQLPESFRQHRASIGSSLAPSATAATLSDKTKEISARSILRISNTARYPALEIAPGSETDTETSEPAISVLEPIQHVPEETIEGQFGLVKHRLLADKRRVLTLDTAGDVLLWDLIQVRQVPSQWSFRINGSCCSANRFKALARNTLKTSNRLSTRLRMCHRGARSTRAPVTSQLCWSLSTALMPNYTPMNWFWTSLLNFGKTKGVRTFSQTVEVFPQLANIATSKSWKMGFEISLF